VVKRCAILDLRLSVAQLSGSVASWRQWPSDKCVRPGDRSGSRPLHTRLQRRPFVPGNSRHSRWCIPSSARRWPARPL